MKTAFTIIRVSAEDQLKGYGPDVQWFDDVIPNALLLGLKVDENYKRVIQESATSWERVKFEATVREAMALHRVGEIEALLFPRVDRETRFLFGSIPLLVEIVQSGLEVYFAREKLRLDPNDSESVERYLSKATQAQAYVETMKVNTMGGKRRKARQGKLSTGGTPLFGYEHIEVEQIGQDGKKERVKKRAIIPEQAEIVRRVFRLIAEEHHTLYGVAAELNRDEIPAPRGGKWSEHTSHRLVTNPAYMGKTYVFRYKVVEPKKPRNRERSYSKTTHVFRDRSEWIELPGITPAIVSPETFDAAQEQLKVNRLRSPRSRKHHYLLGGGRFRCGVCGRSMIGSVKKKPRGDWLYYRCVCNVKTNYYSHCEQRAIAASTIEPLVWDEIARVLKQPDVLLKEIERQRGTAASGVFEADMILVENNIASLRGEEQRYLRLYGRGWIEEGRLDAEIERVKGKRTDLEGKLRHLRHQKEEMEMVLDRYERVSESLDRIASAVDGADFEMKRLALEALDTEVIISRDRSVLIKGSIPVEVAPYVTTW